ncbi:hypothetical protein AB0C84_42610 [Actinomadura sp. NPDC048955]|uniref:hypothetical protein n=1 Tax=Actinomadura sp. NPDC048955 TaxID=3158228 RepID=UPI003409E296
MAGKSIAARPSTQVNAGQLSMPDQIDTERTMLLTELTRIDNKSSMFMALALGGAVAGFTTFDKAGRLAQVFGQTAGVFFAIAVLVLLIKVAWPSRPNAMATFIVYAALGPGQLIAFLRGKHQYTPPGKSDKDKAPLTFDEVRESDIQIKGKLVGIKFFCQRLAITSMTLGVTALGAAGLS